MNKPKEAASAQVREVEALPVCENAQQERGGQDANPVNSANTPFTAGNVDVARQPASSVEYRVVTLGADFEPQMRYQSGVGGVWTWFPLTRDGYWVEPDAYSFGVVTQRSPMPQEEAERAVLRARAINGAHITPANAVKPAPEPAPVAQGIQRYGIAIGDTWLDLEDDGEYVLYSDHARIVAARDAAADFDCDDRRDDADFWWNVAAFRAVEIGRQIAQNEALEASLAACRAALQQIEDFTAYQNCDNCLEMNAVARAATNASQPEAREHE